MKMIIPIMITAALLCGSAAPASGVGASTVVAVNTATLPTTPPEPERIVQQSMKQYYISPTDSFPVANDILPLSKVDEFKRKHQDPETYVDVCTFTRNHLGRVVLIYCEHFD
ncbi:MAG: hypothetical protein AAB901_01865 [Patescibacteria group bacterium]